MADQAEGLRRLFAADSRRMVALVSSTDRGGDAFLLAGLAAALAGQGSRVLLLDEALAAGQRHAAFGVRPRHDLGDVLAGQLEVGSALTPTRFGVDLLAGGGRSALHPRPGMQASIGLASAFHRLAGGYDYILVHAGKGQPGFHPDFALACQDIILPCGGQPESMTRVYARIKALHQAGERRFHLLFDGVDEPTAQLRFRRLAAVSRRHLHLTPGYLGALPAGSAHPEEFIARLAERIQGWPLPDQHADHFPAMMRRLLGGSHTPAARAL